MKVNRSVPSVVLRTHEGAPAKRINAEAALRRSIMCCLLWEDSFYEGGEAIANRIKSLIEQVDPDVCASLAVAARTQMKLRHVPLYMATVMASLPTHKGKVGDLLPKIIQRADELAEFVAIYWKGKEGKVVLSKQVKKGLARSFGAFNEYQFAKYNRDGQFKLRDVMFLVHPKPVNREQEALFKKIAENTLTVPDTWEVALSAGADKKDTWERLILEGKLGALALLRNLRNMKQVGVEEEFIRYALEHINVERVLPFRFIAAARYAPQWESLLEPAMMKCMEGMDKLPGKTVLLVDVSGSMSGTISSKSDMSRIDAACGLAILAREMCQEVAVYTFSSALVRVPDRHGFALRDAINNSQNHGSTYLGRALEQLHTSGEKYDRIIVMTDEQSHDAVPNPKGTGYVINVASYQNGVGYGPWLHVDGWSEQVIAYISALETEVVDTKE